MSQQPAHILVADDEDAVRLTLNIILQRQGYDVTVAANGTEAVELIEQRRFDLLLLDLKMPGLDGVGVALHASQIQPDAKILILTGSSSIDGAPDELRAAGLDYMLKTASPQAVLARIAEILGRS
jgi:DNA-binding NtrC family response regulator